MFASNITFTLLSIEPQMWAILLSLFIQYRIQAMEILREGWIIFCLLLMRKDVQAKFLSEVQESLFEGFWQGLFDGIAESRLIPSLLDSLSQALLEGIAKGLLEILLCAIDEIYAHFNVETNETKDVAV